MDIVGLRHIDKNVKQRQARSMAFEMVTVFTMARRFLLAYANATRTAYGIYDPRIALLGQLSKGWL
jgi:hypothetical protein